MSSQMNGHARFRRRHYPVSFGYPGPAVVVAKSEGDCSCSSGNQIEQKIKENPILFVVGALLAGYLLAKK